MKNNQGMGVHILLNLYGCHDLSNAEIMSSINKAAKTAGLEILDQGEHDFNPGFTFFLLLGESHLSVHTWPEHGSVAVDIFCCYLDPDARFRAKKKARLAADEIIKIFAPTKIDEKLIER